MLKQAIHHLIIAVSYTLHHSDTPNRSNVPISDTNTPCSTRHFKLAVWSQMDLFPFAYKVLIFHSETAACSPEDQEAGLTVETDTASSSSSS